ncbi:MAG: HEAT repeat domain-containing protein [Promethearchaeota archaeon]
MENDQDDLEKLAFLLVDHDVRTRRAVLKLFEEMDPESYTIKPKEDTIIATLPPEIQHSLLVQLHAGMKSGSDNYKIFASLLLGSFSFEAAFVDLLLLLKNPTTKVILAAITALGLFKSPEAVSHLLPLIYDEDHHFVSRKAIETIAVLGNEGDGVVILIHELFIRGDKNPAHLEAFIQSYGGQIFKFVEMEIEIESHPHRKSLLVEYYDKISKEFQVDVDGDYTILL